MIMMENAWDIFLWWSARLKKQIKMGDYPCLLWDMACKFGGK